AALYEKTYRKAGERAYIAVPLRREERWAATLWASTDQPRDWTPREVALLETIAERTWLAVEKLRLDAELRHANSRFERAESASGGFVYEWDVKTRRVERTTGFRQVMGYTPEETSPDSEWWNALIHPDDLEGFRKETASALEREESYSV